MSTHQQLLYHIIFSTKSRKRLLNGAIRSDVFAYMAGVCKNLDGFALEIGGYYDHVHLLVRIPAKTSVSNFVGRVKSNTSRHINQQSGPSAIFAWQDGFGAFSVSPSNVESVRVYLQNQMEHHRELSFEDEYRNFLKKHDVEFDDRYVFC